MLLYLKYFLFQKQFLFTNSNKWLTLIIATTYHKKCFEKSKVKPIVGNFYVFLTVNFEESINWECAIINKKAWRYFCHTDLINFSGIHHFVGWINQTECDCLFYPEMKLRNWESFQVICLNWETWKLYFDFICLKKMNYFFCCKEKKFSVTFR